MCTLAVVVSKVIKDVKQKGMFHKIIYLSINLHKSIAPSGFSCWGGCNVQTVYYTSKCDISHNYYLMLCLFCYTVDRDIFANKIFHL